MGDSSASVPAMLSGVSSNGVTFTTQMLSEELMRYVGRWDLECCLACAVSWRPFIRQEQGQHAGAASLQRRLTVCERLRFNCSTAG